MYKLGLIQERLNRVALYFPNPEVRAVITNGVGGKKASEISDKEVRTGLEESVWGYNLMRYITKESIPHLEHSSILEAYIDQLLKIREFPADKHFYKGVDSGGKSSEGELFPAIDGRLADRLVLLAKGTPSLDQSCKEKIQELYSCYQGDIDSRRERHDRDEAKRSHDRGFAFDAHRRDSGVYPYIGFCLEISRGE